MVVFPDMEQGQYYIRARVQKGEEYGLWSETIGFLFEETTKPSNPDDDEIVYIEEIEILSGIEHGLIGESFLFELNRSEGVV